MLPGAILTSRSNVRGEVRVRATLAERRSRRGGWASARLPTRDGSLRQKLRNRSRTGRASFELTLAGLNRLVKVDRVRRCFEPERYDVVPGQHACAQRTDFHLDEVSAIITEPDLCEGRRGDDRELVVDALCHSRCCFRDAQRCA